MDVQLGEVSGIDLTALLTALPAPPRVVVLTAYSDTATAIGAVQAGAVGFVSKDGPAEHVVTAVRAAVLGGTWFPANLLSAVLAAPESPLLEPLAQLFIQLTDRERQVLRLMVCGLDRKAISARLNRSPDTVKTHIRNIAAKLGTSSMAEAVAVALRAGLRPELRRRRCQIRGGARRSRATREGRPAVKGMGRWAGNGSGGRSPGPARSRTRPSFPGPGRRGERSRPRPAPTTA
jgi:DNA-binding NarL/FixJ family response regulator